MSSFYFLSGYCMAPLKVGPCRAAFPRWQYDATQGLCTEFHFGGCNANENNYLSENDCMSACQGVKGKPLKISPKKTSVTNDKDCSIYFFFQIQNREAFIHQRVSVTTHSRRESCRRAIMHDIKVCVHLCI